MNAPVQLQIAPETRYLRLARLTASAVATDLDFDLDEIDDLKIAIDELCAVLLHDATGPLDLAFSTDDDAIVVEGRAPTTSSEPTQLHPIAVELLDMVTDEYECAHGDGHRSFRLRRARRDPDT